MEDEKQGDVTVDLFAALDMEMEAAAERSSELENSQTLGLLMGFLAVDDWYLRSEYSVFGPFLFFFFLIFYIKFFRLLDSCNLYDGKFICFLYLPVLFY